MGMNAGRTAFIGNISLTDTSTISLNGTDQTIIRDMTDLQNMNSSLGGNYVLGTNLNATDVAFNPIGNSGADGAFSGTMDGLGHTISALTINTPSSDYVGLFGSITKTHIGNIGVENASITGRYAVGGLVGDSKSSTISNSYANGTIGGLQNVGGLVGLANTTTIEGSSAAGSIAATNANISNIGGLVGNSSSSTISKSSAAVAIALTNTVTKLRFKRISQIGGLVGNSSMDTISNSHTTGTITITGNNDGGALGVSNIGGLVGNAQKSTLSNDASHNVMRIGVSTTNNGDSNFNNFGGLVGSSDSSTYLHTESTGDLAITTSSGVYQIGGLIGNSTLDTISHSDTSGTMNITTSEGDSIGGLVGAMYGTTLDGSYSTMAITAANSSSVGGLAGYMNANTQPTLPQTKSAITNSYATGSVKADNGDSIGGMVGSVTNSTITDSYSTGVVNGANNVGGLVGYANSATITDSFYDSSVNSTLTANSNNVGKTTAELHTQSTFANWDISSIGSDDTVWRIYEGNTGPLLRSFLTQVTATTSIASGATQVYDGTTPTPTPTHNSDSVGEMAHIIVNDNTISSKASEKVIAMQAPTDDNDYFKEEESAPNLINGGIHLPQGVIPDIDDTTLPTPEGH
jgi:hypothetical protein